MTDDSKPGKPTPRLPPSGLASEILDQLARGELTVDEEEQSAAQADEARADIDRIYTFTDSLQFGQEEEETHEVYETWVEFRLDQELFALPVSQVREILRVRAVTPVPHPPFPVIGVINLRGRAVPLLDLRARLALPTPPPTTESRIVLVESQKRRIGLLVDSVERVAQLAQSAIQPSGTAAEPPEIRGLHLADGRRTRLLDLTAVLTLRD